MKQKISSQPLIQRCKTRVGNKKPVTQKFSHLRRDFDIVHSVDLLRDQKILPSA